MFLASCSLEDYNHPKGADKPHSLWTLVAIGMLGAISAAMLVSLVIYIVISFVVDFINICCRGQYDHEQQRVERISSASKRNGSRIPICETNHLDSHDSIIEMAI